MSEHAKAKTNIKQKTAMKKNDKPQVEKTNEPHSGHSGRGQPVMTNPEKLELTAFVLLFVALAYWLVALVPRSALTDFGRPEMLAALATVLVTFALLFLRVLPQRRLGIERSVYALFLAGMPLIYFAAAYLSGSRDDLFTESIGVPIFAGLAVFGYYKSFLALGFGIMAHGVAWDSWHHHSHAFIASWYPMACLLADIAFGLLIITQARAHQGFGTRNATMMNCSFDAGQLQQDEI